MEQLLLIVLNGAVYGLLLFMLSSGLTLIYGMMGVLNLAHASFYMLGAFLAFSISIRIGFWPALVLAPLLVGVLGAAVERWGLRAVHRHGHVASSLELVPRQVRTGNRGGHSDVPLEDVTITRATVVS